MMRWVLNILGFLLMGLGALGVVLPGLPTTPFLILAAACFAKSSPRFHLWLLRNPVFGPVLKNWQETRSIPRKAKWLALIMILLVGAVSVFTLENLTFRVGIVGLLVVPFIVLLRLPLTENVRAQERQVNPASDMDSQ